MGPDKEKTAPIRKKINVIVKNHNYHNPHNFNTELISLYSLDEKNG